MKPSSITIRPVVSTDAPAWIALRGELWPTERDEHAADVAKYFAERSPDLQTFVAVTAEGQIVGFLELGTRPYAEGCSSSPVPYVEGWYVRPEARNRGTGRLLLEAAEQWARARGFSELASDAVLNNAAGIAVHKHLGFQETERIVTFIKALK